MPAPVPAAITNSTQPSSHTPLTAEVSETAVAAFRSNRGCGSDWISETFKIENLSKGGASAQSFEPPEFFRHDSLDLNSDNIRALRIFPGSTSRSRIQCSIGHEPLRDKHVCLSYTWGSEAADHLIYINGAKFLVRRNLWHFLWQAREAKLFGPLWIDAICIDQTHKKERNHQVARMAQIYSQAYCVYVWLGCGSLGIEEALKKIQRGARSVTKPHGNATSFSEATEEFAALPYWSRLWIIQEVLLARRARILYGTFNMSWKHFVRILQVWPLEVGHIRAEFERLVQLQQDLGLKRKPSLTDLVLRFKQSQCRDPRDRVYGFLGLADDGKAFHVDYNEPAVGLLIRVLKASSFDSRKEMIDLANELSDVLHVPLISIKAFCHTQTGIGSSTVPNGRFSIVRNIWKYSGTTNIGNKRRSRWKPVCSKVQIHHLCISCTTALLNAAIWLPEISTNNAAYDVNFAWESKSDYSAWAHGSLTMTLHQGARVISEAEAAKDDGDESDASTNSLKWPPTRPEQDDILIESEARNIGSTPDKQWLMLVDGQLKGGNPQQQLGFMDPCPDPRWCLGYVDAGKDGQRPIGEAIESIIPWTFYQELEKANRNPPRIYCDLTRR